MASPRELDKARRHMKDKIVAAFLAVRKRKSPDVVIADPELNRAFLEECRRLGLTQADVALNLALFRLRKSHHLQGFKSERTTVKNQGEYRFASEIAVRFLERRDHLSLDQILCDPKAANEFDKIAEDIAPGYSSFKYRWAALNLRKTRRLQPEIIARVVPIVSVVTHRASDIDVQSIPPQQGIYVFFDSKSVLYVGECRNLRKRIAKHLDHSDNKGLARWLWTHGATKLHLEYQILGTDVPTRVRKALEAQLILSRRPLLNIAGVRHPPRKKPIHQS